MRARYTRSGMLLALWLIAAAGASGQEQDVSPSALYLDLMTPDVTFGSVPADGSPRVVERALRALIESDDAWSLSVRSSSGLGMVGSDVAALPIERLQWRPHGKAEAQWRPFGSGETEILSRQAATTDSGRHLEHDYRLTALWGDAPGAYGTVLTYTVSPSLDAPVLEPMARGASVVTGRVSDRATLDPLEGAVVLLTDANDRVVAETTTDAEGGFLLDGLADGPYVLRVSRDYYYTTTVEVVVSGQGAVDVPVLLQHNRTLMLTRELTAQTASAGDILRCTLRVTHVGAGPALHVAVVETLPTGFHHMDGHGAPPPDAQQPPFLVWNLRDVTPGEAITLTYLVAVGADASLGEHTLIAEATAHTLEGPVRAEAARARVHVAPVGTMGDMGVLVGVVYEDANGNSRRDAGERGVADAEVVVDSGAVVMTDEHGRYSLAGVSTGMHSVYALGAGLPTNASAPLGGILRLDLPVSSKRVVSGISSSGAPVVRLTPQPSSERRDSYVLGAGEISLRYDPLDPRGIPRVAGRAGATLSHSLDGATTVGLTARVGERSSVASSSAEMLGDASRLVRPATPGVVGITFRTPGTEARLGTERVLIEDNQFATYASVLPAAQVTRRSGSTDTFAFAGANMAPTVVDEIDPDGTTGPYRLTRTPVVPSSETVRLEYRDPSDARVVSEKRRARIVDYGIDYTSGEIVFREPVLETSSGNDVTIVVEYQQQRPGTVASLVGPTIYGARATTRLAPRALVGATVLSQGEAGHGARLLAADARLRPHDDLTVRLEGARTSGAEAGSATGLRARYEPSRVLRADSFAYSVSEGFGHTVTPANDSDDRRGRIGLHEHRVDRVSRARGVQTRGAALDVKPTSGTWLRAQTRSDVTEVGSGLRERSTLYGAGAEVETRGGSEAYLYGEEARTEGAQGARSTRRAGRTAGHWPMGAHMLLASAALTHEESTSARSSRALSSLHYSGEWEWEAAELLTTEVRYGRSRSSKDGSLSLTQDAVSASAEGSFGEGLTLSALVGTARVSRLDRAEETLRDTASLRARARTPDVDLIARVKASRSHTAASTSADSRELSMFLDGVARDVLSLRADYSLMRGNRSGSTRGRFDLMVRPTAPNAPDILVRYAVSTKSEAGLASGRREVTVRAHAPLGPGTTAHATATATVVRTSLGSASVEVSSVSVGARRELPASFAALLTWQSVRSVGIGVRMVFAPGVEWRHADGWNVRASYGVARHAMPTWAPSRGLCITVGRAVRVATDGAPAFDDAPAPPM
jgi:hypothetical protein